MYKPSSLRKHLSLAVPDFKTNPDKLSILVKVGRLQCAGGRSLSHTHAYTAQIVVEGFDGSPDAVFVPLLVWLRTHQPEIFDNEKLRDGAVRYEVDYNDERTIDLLIELDLTESVIVTPAVPLPQEEEGLPPGRYTIQHIGEPPRPGTAQIEEAWEIWADGQPVAAWTNRPADFDDAPVLTQ
ncbi:tail fiber protein [Hylemonella gracilis str. Niagara R]|uniref:Tail fiber protein n=1 Tax=Hylemonella gracilis str. Niagara R TaxID=1458275 RepID=A0A016XH83_9BURK|nr:phage tail protein [Hylemonella gracilis]EYC51454.1 tail fiber protein [Hylemonella gracilis str. Niagara R]